MILFIFTFCVYIISSKNFTLDNFHYYVLFSNYDSGVYFRWGTSGGRLTSKWILAMFGLTNIFQLTFCLGCLQMFRKYGWNRVPKSRHGLRVTFTRPFVILPIWADLSMSGGGWIFNMNLKNIKFACKNIFNICYLFKEAHIILNRIWIHRDKNSSLSAYKICKTSRGPRKIKRVRQNEKKSYIFFLSLRSQYNLS